MMSCSFVTGDSCYMNQREREREATKHDLSEKENRHTHTQCLIVEE